jgi:hypothetical protein
MKKIIERPRETAMFATLDIRAGETIVGLVGVKPDRNAGVGFKSTVIVDGVATHMDGPGIFDLSLIC